MNSQDPLADLRDIHLPAPVSAWPPAPGWWLLAILLLTALLGLAFWAWRRYRRQRYRRAAVSALRTSYARYREDGDGGRYLREASLILKQAALAAFPRERVAALHGGEWAGFLVDTGGDPALESLADWLAASYRPAVQPESEQLRQLHRLLERWLRRHRC